MTFPDTDDKRRIRWRIFCFQVDKMKKTILFLATLASAMTLMTLSACAYPDHSGVYMDQHNGREEQGHDDHHDSNYQGDNHDDHDRRDDNDTDPRRQ
jgi:hypothetical protein